MAKAKKAKQLYEYTLDNGTTIRESSRGVAGYEGVALSTTWAEGRTDAGVFIAFLGDNDIPKKYRHLIKWTKSWAHHLGSYDDAREAAAVAAMGKADPEWFLTNSQGHTVGAIKEFSEELYTLPMGMSWKAARRLITKKRNARKTAEPKKKFVEVELYGEMRTLPADDMLAIKCVERDLKRGFKRMVDAPDSYFNS